ncbi:MAG: hypothetical protein ACTSPY_17270 [Candidatus Helarchaeota archaeon]
MVNPIKKFIEIIKMLITFPFTFLKYRKGLKNAEEAMKKMLQDPKFRQEYIEYQKFIQGKKPINAEYVDADYFIIDDEDVAELDDIDEDDLDEDLDDIFI